MLSVLVKHLLNISPALTFLPTGGEKRKAHSYKVFPQKMSCSQHFSALLDGATNPFSKGSLAQRKGQKHHFFCHLHQSDQILGQLKEIVFSRKMSKGGKSLNF